MQTRREKLEKQQRKNRIGQNIRIICRNQGMSNRDLARCANVSIGNLESVLYGGRYSDSILKHIAEFLEVSEEELASEDVKEKFEEKEVYLSSNIRLLCILQGMDYNDLTRETGLCYSTIAKLSKGKYSLDRHSLVFLAQVFGVTKKELLYHDFREGRSENFSSNIKALRKKYKIGRDVLSASADVSTYLISKIEKTEASFYPKELAKIARAFEVTIEELVFGTF